MPGYETNSWGGVIGPAKLPKEIVSRLTAEIRKALAAPAVAERYRQLDTEPDGAGPEAFLELVRKETPKWADVVKKSGARLIDLVIRDATVIDGTRAPRFAADIAIRDGRIAAIGASTKRRKQSTPAARSRWASSTRTRTTIA